MRQGYGRAALAGTIAAAALAAGALPAQGMTLPPGWRIYDGGSSVTRFVVPAGVSGMQYVAVGGRGGGAAGGLGAVVQGELQLTPGQTVAIGPGADGGAVGTAAPGVVLPGRGGRASIIGTCAVGAECTSTRIAVVAAAGGGSGGGTAGLPGGAGGAAGAPGANGTDATGVGEAAEGGAAATATAPGAGGAGQALPSGSCARTVLAGDGDAGGPLLGGDGGGVPSEPARLGGGGGGGLHGGGGGGGAALCDGDQAGATAGGGGGASVVPAGAQLFASTGAEQAHVRLALRWEAVAPTVTVTAPAEGASYEQGATVAAAYACADEDGGSGIDACVGPVAAGAPIDTATLGPKTFTVTARDRGGNETVRTVTYTVRPAVARIPLLRKRVSASARAVHFFLISPTTVTLRFERRAPGRRPRWTHVGTISRAGRRGQNVVRLAGRVGRRALRRGAYRVLLRAADARALRPVTLRFTVAGRPTARGRARARR